MHALEKILLKKSNVGTLATGDTVNCRVDFAGINDLYWQTIMSFRELGGTQVACPEKTAVFFDHFSPAATVRQAENHHLFREFCKEQQIDKLMDINEGVCHQIIREKGFARPGDLVVVTDSHTTTHGAVGAFSVGVGATDLAVILLTGQLWFRVPEIVRINVEGSLPSGVDAKDLILYIIGKLGTDFAIYKAVEFSGSTIRNMELYERSVLCNMTTEMGAKTTYIAPDEKVLAYLESIGSVGYEAEETDPGYQYAQEIFFDGSQLTPQVAAPSHVGNVHPKAEYVGTAIQQAYIGSCTGGRLEDIAAAARVLDGKEIARGVRLVLVPASKKVLSDAISAGYLDSLLKAGATLATPGCAACLGVHQGLLAANEVCITTTNRNFPGRMGHVEAQIYLASPETVALAALHGCIA